MLHGLDVAATRGMRCRGREYYSSASRDSDSHRLSDAWYSDIPPAAKGGGGMGGSLLPTPSTTAPAGSSFSVAPITNGGAMPGSMAGGLVDQVVNHTV